MKHLFSSKISLSIFLFLFLLCCTQEETSDWNILEDKEIQAFFALDEIQSRAGDSCSDWMKIVINTLCTQENLIDAVRTYKEKYGTPMWQHCVEVATENGYQLFVPVYKKEYEDEIKSIWNFGIYNDTLYHFTDVRNENAQYVEEYWKFDYFTCYVLGNTPVNGLKFYTESRAVYKCVHAYITVGEGIYEYTEDKGFHCWEVDEKLYLATALDGDLGSSGSSGGGSSDGGFTSGTSVSVGGGGSNSGISSNSGNSTSDTSDSNSDTSDPILGDYKQQVDDKLRINCGIAGILDNIGGLDNLTGIILSRDYTGGYNSETKTIIMAFGWDGDVTSKAFVEELIHYMQDQVYPNGIGPLYETTLTNIEFEAKVMVDSYVYGKSGKFYRVESMVLQRIGKENISTENYIDFLNKIKKGKLKNEEYIRMLNLYNQYTPYLEYQGKVDPNLSPLLLNTYGRNMYSNKCK